MYNIFCDGEKKKEKFSDHVCGDRLPQIDAVLQYHNILFFATEITDDGSCYSANFIARIFIANLHNNR